MTLSREQTWIVGWTHRSDASTIPMAVDELGADNKPNLRLFHQSWLVTLCCHAWAATEKESMKVLNYGKQPEILNCNCWEKALKSALGTCTENKEGFWMPVTTTSRPTPFCSLRRGSCFPWKEEEPEASGPAASFAEVFSSFCISTPVPDPEAWADPALSLRFWSRGTAWFLAASIVGEWLSGAVFWLTDACSVLDSCTGTFSSLWGGGVLPLASAECNCKVDVVPTESAPGEWVAVGWSCGPWPSTSVDSSTTTVGWVGLEVRALPMSEQLVSLSGNMQSFNTLKQQWVNLQLCLSQRNQQYQTVENNKVPSPGSSKDAFTTNMVSTTPWRVCCTARYLCRKRDRFPLKW